MSNKLIKMKDMELLNQEFNGDEILTIKLKNDNKIYIGVSSICEGLGFSKNGKDAQVRKIQKDKILSKGAIKLSLPTKGGNQTSLVLELDYLPIWLAKIEITKKLLESEDISNKLIEYQLKAKDVLAQAFLGKQKQWDLQREVGKIDRNRMTNSIKEYHENPKFYTYANYTDMVYKVLFNKTAKQIREERNISKKSEQTRDYLNDEELKLVDEAETIVTALTTLGFKYDYIKDQLERKYIKKIESV